MITLFETFAGIGSQYKSLKKFYNIKNLGISEWYIDAIIAYAKIHYIEKYKKYCNLYKNLTKKQILEELKNVTFSSDSKKEINLNRLNENKLKELYICNKIVNNYGSILNIKGKDLPNNIDIFTYSFPCQSLSLQGKQKGLNGDTPSALVWQILRILKEMPIKPKILLMENVPALFSKKFINDWKIIKEELNKIGYNTKETILNSMEEGSIQIRKRAFAVSIRKDLNKKYEFKSKKLKHNKNIESILINNTNYEYLIQKEKLIQNNIKKYCNMSFKVKNSGLITSELKGYTTFQSANILYSIKGKCPTITSVGANSKIKIIDTNNNLRYLSSFEIFKIMGFSEKDYKNLIYKSCNNYEFSGNKIIKLTGNSIDIHSLDTIFENIKDYL